MEFDIAHDKPRDKDNSRTHALTLSRTHALADSDIGIDKVRNGIRTRESRLLSASASDANFKFQVSSFQSHLDPKRSAGVW